MSASPQEQQPPVQESLGSNAEDLYLESYAFTTAAAIVGSVDRKIFVLLRDGRNVFGILRTFDQFANLVLQDTVERIYLPKVDEQAPERFAEAPKGVFMVRGENVVMLGELDIDREDDHLVNMQRVGFQEAEAELKSRQAARVADEKIKAKNYLNRGLIHDFVKSDLY
ncbi:CIC11C00000001551 [Sungouiella intermedia]|uniref:U6 snRNA-associated Sm-like protein LSm1 n=1 Tax=Sungouiella intermedia TaxID=45354 RepID=A0A1L0CZ55_9ASCO|nr:CIC11C00000001551 [[Candida] intermedia]SGZ58699.1 CIC11C00000004366 [[Candida] intermedia]